MSDLSPEKTVRLKVNGEARFFEGPLTLASLLERLGVSPERVVVELNLEIVPRQDLARSPLKDADQVEIVHFVGGGAKASKLVIVESPAKCKTIQKYLGGAYEVAASMGHVIDLPRSRMGIDVDKDFTPQYTVVKERKKTLSELKKRAKGKDEIILACDPDREGEAISWHLANQLGEGRKVVRVVFNEITKEAILEAFKHPSPIDLHLVGAQQARRVLDRLMGYSLSPLLWQKVGRGLSAGRVQSVALRMIVDQERRIRAFKPEEYWSIEAEFLKPGTDRPFAAKLERLGEDKVQIPDKSTADSLLERVRSASFEVGPIRRQHKKRNPSAPFTTSKLQQAAYNQLHFPASKTMKVAQTLYEGVELGAEGPTGLITYMRTDSVRITDAAVQETRQLIAREHGKEYLPEKPNVYKAKKQAQEAHEAIRPTSVARRPQDLASLLSPDQLKLYTLIWNQTVASQMKPATVFQETVDVVSGDFVFRATGSRIEFPGYLAVMGPREDGDESPLPPLETGDALRTVKMDGRQHFTKPPPRFTDATLVKALEEKGIGRPSTYAPTIMTIIDRDYVRREGGSLVPSELGMLVTDLLVQHFARVLDLEFTATMETELDDVEEGKADWVKVVREFYDVFQPEIETARENMQSVKKKDEPTDEICDKCGKPMVIKWGRRGRFMSCSGWPECKNAKSISTDVVCPQCGQGKLVQRRARSGRGRPFYGCTRYPECTFIANKLPSPEGAGGVSPEASGGASGEPPVPG